MYDIFTFLVSVALCYGLYKCLKVTARRQRANELGCRKTHFRNNRLPFGLDGAQRLVKGDKNGQLLQDVREMFLEEGRRTFKTRIFGSTAIHTVEPMNIQAMMATQFGDFELGKMRRGVLFPLIGNGISTADGKAW